MKEAITYLITLLALCVWVYSCSLPSEKTTQVGIPQQMELFKQKLSGDIPFGPDSALSAIFSEVDVRKLKKLQVPASGIISQLALQKVMPDKAIEALQSAETYVQSALDSALLDLYYGKYYLQTFDYKKAALHLERSESFQPIPEEEGFAGELFLALSQLAFETGNYLKSRFYSDLAEEALQKQPKSVLHYKSLIRKILELEKLEKPTNHQLKVVQLETMLSQSDRDTSLFSDLKGCLAKVYLQSCPDTAIYYLTRQIADNLATGRTYQNLLCTLDLAQARRNNQQPQEAQKILETLLEDSQSSKLPYLRGLANIQLAEIYMSQKDYPKATAFLHTARTQINAAQNLFQEIVLANLLVSCNQNPGYYQKAFEAAQHLDSISVQFDSLVEAFNLELVHRTLDMEIVRFEKQQLEEKIRLQKETMYFKNKGIAVTAPAFILLLIFLRSIVITRNQALQSTKVLLEWYRKELKNNSPNTEAPKDPSNSSIIKHSLLALLNDEQIYLQHNLKVDQVANQLNIPYSTLNQLIKDEFDTNFTGLINQYRIDHAKKLLADSNFEHYSIEGISKEAGFNTKQSFYRTFSKLSGVSPQTFKNAIQEKKP